MSDSSSESSVASVSRGNRTNRFKLKPFVPLTLPISVSTQRRLVRNYYSIRLIGIKPLSRFNLAACEYEIKFNFNGVPFFHLFPLLRHCLREILFIVTSNVCGPSRKYYKIRTVLTAPSLRSPINFPIFGSITRQAVDVLLGEIERTVQSNDTLLMDDRLNMYFVSYFQP